MQHIKLLFPVLLVASTIYTDANRNSTSQSPSDPDTAPNEVYSDVNTTDANGFWKGVIRDCKTPTISCIQKNVFHYLHDTFQYRGDIAFGGVNFKRNKVDYTKYTREANMRADKKVEDADDDDDDEEPATPLEEVTRALHDKSVGFMMTHDVELQLPETLFEGSTLKVSPRAIEDDGVLVKLDLIPKELQKAQQQGRILFKKIKKFFKDKLVMAFMSIVLVLGLIKAKLMFIMPIIVGIGTAKKILLNVLLFLFPALSHLFKLCSYYHNSYHNTKYHEHHHQISHVHHLPSVHHSVPDIHSHPPPDHEGGGGYYQDYEYPGPGLGPEFISNRNAFDHTPSADDENEIKSWGLGHVQGHKGNNRRGQQSTGTKAPMLNVKQMEELALQAEREVMLKARLQQEQQRIRQENLQLQEQLRQELKLQEQLQLQALMIAQQKTKLQPQPQPQQQSVRMSSYDPFYSPILQKIDKVFTHLSINSEPCRERLVCSMYKNPMRFSPHSNLISAELSRDPKELQKPTSNNEAVIRFYRYVQAARDGQDQRECLRLYPACNINTEL